MPYIAWSVNKSVGLFVLHIPVKSRRFAIIIYTTVGGRWLADTVLGNWKEEVVVFMSHS